MIIIVQNNFGSISRQQDAHWVPYQFTFKPLHLDMESLPPSLSFPFPSLKSMLVEGSCRQFSDTETFHISSIVNLSTPYQSPSVFSLHKEKNLPLECPRCCLIVSASQMSLVFPELGNAVVQYFLLHFWELKYFLVCTDETKCKICR